MTRRSIQDITAPLSGARIKFFNFGVNAPAVNFYANDTKVTAISTAAVRRRHDTATVRVCNTVGIEATTGTASGSPGSAGLYSAVAPAQYTFNARVATTTDKGVQVAKAPMTLVDGSAYSFYVSGFYDGTTKRRRHSSSRIRSRRPSTSTTRTCASSTPSPTRHQ